MGATRRASAWTEPPNAPQGVTDDHIPGLRPEQGDRLVPGRERETTSSERGSLLQGCRWLERQRERHESWARLLFQLDAIEQRDAGPQLVDLRQRSFLRQPSLAG